MTLEFQFKANKNFSGFKSSFEIAYFNESYLKVNIKVFIEKLVIF